MRIPGSDERWENWVQFAQSRLVPRFTRRGFKVAQVPPHLHEQLLSVVQDGVDHWDDLDIEQGTEESIYNRLGLSPKMVMDGTVWDTVHSELLPLHEEWSGLKLFPTSIYGVRMYQNSSSLVMHVDKVYLVMAYYVI